MKKIITLFLAVILIISLVGCSVQQAMPTDSDTDSEIVSDTLTETDGTETDTESTGAETETAETEATSDDTTANTVEPTEDNATVAITQTNKSETTTKKETTTKATTASTSKETSTKGASATTTKESTTKKTETTTKKNETTTKKSETTTKGHTHSYTSSVTTKATCTKAGVKTFKCSCGASYTESIPATGHDWKTTTVHHDAVYGKRDITEEWTHVAYFRHLYLDDNYAYLDNQKEMRKDEMYSYKYGNKEFAPMYTIKVAEITVKSSEYQQWITTWKPTASLQWLYRYDTSSVDITTMASNATSDFIKKYGYTSINSYGDATSKKTETKVVGTETYVITDAYDETVTTCTTCGAHK